MDTFDKIKKSWWVVFPFTVIFSGFGFIYIGLKSSNKNWMLEGITYELPFFLYIVASTAYPSSIMVGYYIWIILLAAFIALIRSVMVAIKLFDVYEMETPRVRAVPVSNNNASTSSGNVNSENTSKASRTVDKVKEKSNSRDCCCCVILIFIIFAIIAIL